MHVLQFQQAEEFDLLTIEGALTVLYPTACFFLYCDVAAQVSAYFDTIDAYESLWYEYPFELQRSVILIIRRSQVPLRFDALSMFYCELRTFTKVN